MLIAKWGKLLGKFIMQNNDVLKKIKIALSLKDSDLVKMFQLGGLTVTRSFCKFVSSKAATNPEFRALKDGELDAFLQGLIAFYRGGIDK